MSQQLDNLVAQVQATDGVIDSVVTLLGGVDARLADLSAQLVALGIDNQVVEDTRADLQAHTEALAAAAAAVPPVTP